MGVGIDCRLAGGDISLLKLRQRSERSPNPAEIFRGNLCGNRLLSGDGKCADGRSAEKRGNRHTPFRAVAVVEIFHNASGLIACGQAREAREGKEQN